MAAQSLCERFGVTGAEIERRLEMMNITGEDEERLAEVQHTIAENSKLLSDAFYEHLLRFPELSRFIADESRLTRLRDALAQHLLTMGQGMWEPSYFEARLRVGEVHDRNGIQPKWYVAAYAHLRALLNELICRAVPQERLASTLISLNRVICLDMELALEIYHRSAVYRIEKLMTELEAGQDEIRKLAQTDQLTGLSNRRHFMESLESEFHRCRRYERPLCLLMMDLDDFKAINDTYGHQMGDAVLRKIGRMLPALVRSTDCCGRIGGEEMGVILVETTLERARMIAERIRLAVVQTEFDGAGARSSVSLSIGLAECTAEVHAADELVRWADDALYEAKSLGKNCVRLAGPPTPSQPAPSE